MSKNLANLTVNPCKMCMPMGAMTAFYGIKNCISILHGSQGCSTYIRRHMATHYNEPVDIASSSLTEEGTVYGGEKNLIKGLVNLIKVYEPEVIGVATTCLAETIGEDVRRIIDKFYEEYPEYNDIAIINVSTAGYGGTQYEGFMAALYQLVKSTPMDIEANHMINVITGQLSPADTRYLKELLDDFGIDYILLPDLSENLDDGHYDTYHKLPRHGTSMKDISKMGGARMTLELSTFAGNTKSAAKYLYEEYGVPYQSLNLPVGLRDNDELLRILSELSGTKLSEKLVKQRARFLDAMIDGHKYNGEVRAAVYGEPDFVYATIRMCVENGIMPLITATGSKCPGLKELLEPEIRTVAEAYYIDRYEILDEIDFETIEELSRELGVNLLIGNSDGRRIAEKLKLPLVRRSFPIHDRVGGQRIRMLGYEGALTFLDDISNEILSRKETGFREELYEKYYKGDKSKTEVTNRYDEDNKTTEEVLKPMNQEVKSEMSIEERTAKHPCYNCGAHDYARIHLPVAPKCNISCNYCLRKFDCPNESRPGVTTAVLNPQEAFERYKKAKIKVPKLSVVGIAGPGDALANFEATKETLRLIREYDPEVTFCLSTNGLMLPQYANDLIELSVSHITVTMNAVDPKIGAQIYKYVDYMGIKYYGEAAAAILMSNQLAGIRMLAAKGIICKVNIVMLKGINDHHIPEVVAKVKELGGTITNIMQLIPVQGSVFENLPLVSNVEIMEMRKKCGETMQQMYHCKQCRADAIGTLEDDLSIEFNACHKETSDQENKNQASEGLSDSKIIIGSIEDTPDAVQLAVATKSGMLVDQHFGHATEFYIYEYSNGNAIYKEKRQVAQYCIGNDYCGEADNRMDLIINTISDCNAVIAMRIGDAPKQKLSDKGIKTFTTYDRIEDSVRWAAEKLITE